VRRLDGRGRIVIQIKGKSVAPDALQREVDVRRAEALVS